MRTLSFMAALLLVVMHPASAQRFVTLGVSDTEVLATLQKLQKAVGAGDRATVAGLVNYPLHINRGAGDHTSLRTSAELLKRYDEVFTAEVRTAIAAEKLTDVFGSTEGVPVGKGMVWLSSTCNGAHPPTCHVGITSVNIRKQRP
jgi:hypothetical protein